MKKNQIKTAAQAAKYALSPKASEEVRRGFMRGCQDLHQFGVGDIVSRERGEYFGIVEGIHKTDLIVRDFNPEGGVHENVRAYPAESCAIVMPAEDVRKILRGILWNRNRPKHKAA